MIFRSVLSNPKIQAPIAIEIVEMQPMAIKVIKLIASNCIRNKIVIPIATMVIEKSRIKTFWQKTLIDSLIKLRKKYILMNNATHCKKIAAYNVL